MRAKQPLIIRKWLIPSVIEWSDNFFTPKMYIFQILHSCFYAKGADPWKAAINSNL